MNCHVRDVTHVVDPTLHIGRRLPIQKGLPASSPGYSRRSAPEKRSGPMAVSTVHTRCRAEIAWSLVTGIAAKGFIVSGEPTEPQAAGSGVPGGNTPRLPVVHFSDEKPRLRVFFSMKEAAEAAQVYPKGPCYDVQGIVLTRARTESGRTCLEAQGEGDPGELKRRLMTELRRAAELEAPDGPEAAEADRLLAWYDDAPDIHALVHALALHPPDYDADDDPGAAFGAPRARYRRCTFVQRACWGSPPCYPRS
jgi:hypothetical protein